MFKREGLSLGLCSSALDVSTVRRMERDRIEANRNREGVVADG